MNQRALAILAIILSISVSGVLIIGMAQHQNDHTCLISVMLGGDCPPSNGFALGIHHVSGFQTLTQATQGPHSTILALAFLLLTVFILAIHKIFKLATFRKYSFAFQRNEESISSSFQKQRRWFAFHNKRDPYALRWA